jgi:hypothetical protein
MFIQSAIQTRCCDLRQMSLVMNPSVHNDSNFKRLQRLINDITLTPLEKRALVKMGRNQVRVAMDRTEWDYGNLTNNLLTCGVETYKIAIPITVTDLGKPGSSSNSERIQALKNLLEVIPAKEIEILTADREFMSVEVLEYLVNTEINYAFRVKSDVLIRHKGVTQSVAEWFCGYRKRSLKKAVMFGQEVNICGKRIKRKKDDKQDFLVIVTNLEPTQGYALYKGRWKVENLYGALKSRGFNLENTHVVQSKRLQNLVMLLGMALLWVVKVGAWVKETTQTRVRKDGMAYYSICRLGLDFLRKLICDPKPNARVWNKVIHVLSCT